MKLLLFASAVLGTAIGVMAECPNMCSGHGRCTNYPPKYLTYPKDETAIPTTAEVTGISAYGYLDTEIKKDTCTCFSHTGYGSKAVYAWTGADCSLRTCPWGPAHADTPTADNDHHTALLECSGKGSCDTNTGECKCFTGFTGKSCSRTVCPNNCSGNGQCLPLTKIAADVAANNGATGYPAYTLANVRYNSAFDKDVQYGCVCDAGRRGADCSEIECPSGTDPMGGLLGSEYGRPCSGRGSCDKGTCVCFPGFFGNRCENQRGRTS